MSKAEMKTGLNQLQVRQLDELVIPWKTLGNEPRPRRGWINAIRSALGMSTTQLAARNGVSRQAIVDLERRERSGGVTLAILDRAAAAMECELVYAIVPKTSLADTLWRRAKSIAARRLGIVAHSMGLEDQEVPSGERQNQINDLAAQILYGSRRNLWDDPDVSI